MTPERKKELDEQYKTAVRGKTPSEIRAIWDRYLAVFHEEKDEKERTDYRIFNQVRLVARMNGGAIDLELLASNITPKQYFEQIKAGCGLEYINSLRDNQLVDIDPREIAYQRIELDSTVEALEAFSQTDPLSKPEVCTSMAKTYHRFVELVHAEYRQPLVSDMVKHLNVESEEEAAVLRSNDFETTMRPARRAFWVAAIT